MIFLPKPPEAWILRSNFLPQTIPNQSQSIDLGMVSLRGRASREERNNRAAATAQQPIDWAGLVHRTFRFDIFYIPLVDRSGTLL